MLYALDVRIACKYLLYLDSIFITLCLLLIYCNDYEYSVEVSNGHYQLSLATAKVMLYYNYILCILIQLYWLYQTLKILAAYTIGTLLLLIGRISCAYYFYFIYNFANLLGMALGAYIIYSTYYEIDTKREVHFPPRCDCFENSGTGGGGGRSKSHRHRRSRKRHRSYD